MTHYTNAVLIAVYVAFMALLMLAGHTGAQGDKVWKCRQEVQEQPATSWHCTPSGAGQKSTCIERER
jgi:hypothetical protein